MKFFRELLIVIAILLFFLGMAVTKGHARVVCDQWGRCWEQADPGEEIVGHVLHGLIPHHHGWQEEHHGWHHHHHDEEEEE